MTVTRPEDLKLSKTKITFNLRSFVELEIDLLHVNKGKRSKFSVKEIARIAKTLLNNEYLAPSDTKKFGSEYCSYFARTAQFDGKRYRLVFCICSDRPNTIGIITLYRC